MEGTSLRPITEFCGVTSNADPLGLRGCGTVKDEQHVPTGRGDVDIWRCLDGTAIARARHLGENDTSSHRVAVRARGSGHKRDLHVCRGTLEVDVDVVGLAVLPILYCDGVCGLRRPSGQIRRIIDLNSEFLGVFLSDAIRKKGLGVGSRDKDATVVKEDRLGVIHTSNNGRAKLRETLANGLGWVIEESVQVRIVRQSEAGNAFVSTVQDEVSPIGEGNHTGHHTLGRLEKGLLLGAYE